MKAIHANELYLLRFKGLTVVLTSRQLRCFEFGATLLVRQPFQNMRATLR